MNYAEKMNIDMNLKTNIADWMKSHGEVIKQIERSNEYVGLRFREIKWQGCRYEIIDVDGKTCEKSCLH